MSYAQTIIGSSIIGLALLVTGPALTLAHGGADDASDTNGTDTDQPMMMHSGEVSDETHEQMEELMHQMWQGELSADEAEQMSEMMSEHQGSFMPMMSGGMMGRGMMNGDAWGQQMPAPMNTWFGGSLLSGMLQVIWLIVGLLAIAWFIKKLRE